MVLIIGANGHGKTSLIKALNNQNHNNKFIETTTNDLINISRALPSEEIEPIFQNSPNKVPKIKGDYKKKNKEVKPWSKTKYYQK